MGAYSPAPVIDDKIYTQVLQEIIFPTVEGMRQEGTSASKSSPNCEQAQAITSDTLSASTSREPVPAISLIEAKSRSVATYQDYRQN